MPAQPKIAFPSTHPQPFNQRAHPIVAALIDAAEVWAITKGLCDPQDAEDFLAITYILENGQFLENATYIENEGRIAADLFLWRLSNVAKAGLRDRFYRNSRACSMQLHWHTDFYFREFRTVLQQTCIRILQNAPDLATIDRNGALKLAVRYLPGADDEINRERRRRGANEDRMFMPFDELNRSMKHFYGHNMTMLKLLSHSPQE